MIKLNLGCGTDIRPGYVNVDNRKLGDEVYEIDLSKFPWPIETNSASEIMMLDFLEHIPYSKTQDILRECYRVLSDDGIIIVQVPDGDHLLNAFLQKGDYLCNRCGNKIHGDDGDQLCVRCGQDVNDISEAAMRRLYGGQDYPGNFHFTAFSHRSLLKNLEFCGFKEMSFLENEHQYKNWNMKVRAVKGFYDIWESMK